MKNIESDEELLLQYREGSLVAFEKLCSKFISNSHAIGYKVYPDGFLACESVEYDCLFSEVLNIAISKYSFGKGRFRNFLCQCLRNALSKVLKEKVEMKKLNSAKKLISLSEEPKNATDCVLEDCIEDISTNEKYIKSTIDCHDMKAILNECVAAHGDSCKKIFDLILKGYRLTEIQKATKIPYFKIRSIVKTVQNEFELILIRDYNVIVR